MGKNDELLIQLIHEEIQGEGGGFEKFCELATDDVFETVKTVFPTNVTQQKKAVKQILVRMYQRIDEADLTDLHTWMHKFSMDVLEKNYPREVKSAKQREQERIQADKAQKAKADKAQENELEAEIDREEDQDDLIAAAMAAFERLQDEQPETQVQIPKEAESFFEPETEDSKAVSSKKQATQEVDTAGIQLESEQNQPEKKPVHEIRVEPIPEVKKENKSAHPVQENAEQQKNTAKQKKAQKAEERTQEELPDIEEDLADDTNDILGDFEEDEEKEAVGALAAFFKENANVKKLVIAAVPCVIAVFVVIALLAGGNKNKTATVSNTANTTKAQATTQAETTQAATVPTTESTQTAETTQEAVTKEQTTENTKKTTAASNSRTTQAATRRSTTTQQTTERTQESVNETAADDGDDSGSSTGGEDTTERVTESPTEEQTSKEEKTTQYETQAPTSKPSMAPAKRD